MTRWIFLLVALTAGCSKKVAWSEKKAIKLTIGPYEIAIPTGWRDLAELQSGEREGKLPPGALGMAPEALSTSGLPNITFTWSPMQVRFTPPTCAQFAEMSARQAQGTTSDVQALTVDGDQGCRWTLNKGDAQGVQAAHFTKDHVLSVTCLRSAKGDAALDAACKQVLATLHFPA